MIWTTWRQHRAEAGVGVALLIVAVGGLVAVGERARQRAQGLGLPACVRAGGDCSKALDGLHRDFHSIPPFTGLLIAVPLLAGMFWAAPLVSREYEAGTHRLAWSQSVGPRRWLLTKIALVFGTVSAASLAVGLLATWALDPLSPAFGGRYNSTWFDIQGVVPLACMLFALAAGLLASVAIRRTIPAMAVTLVVYAAARIPMHWLRVHFAAPSTVSQSKPMSALLDDVLGSPRDLFDSSAPAGSLVRSSTVTVKPSGAAVSSNTSTIDLFRHYCPTLHVTRSGGSINVANADSCRATVHDLSLQATTHFLPPSRFWLLQSIELVLFAGVAIALAVAAVLLVSRRS